VGAMFVLGSAIMTTVGPIVAAIGQYTLYRAAKIQIAILTAKETAAYATNTVAQSAETVSTGVLTSAKLALAGAIKAVGAAMKTTMGMMALAGLAIVGVALAVGAAVKAYNDFKEETRKVREESRELLEAIDDGTESFRENKKAIDDVARVMPQLAKHMTLTTLEQHAQNDAFVKGTDEALRLREEYIDLRNEEVKNLKNIEKTSKGIINLKEARADLRKEIKEDADALFGAVLTEAQALVFLTRQYRLSMEAARELVEQTEYLTQSTLEDAVAARSAAIAQTEFAAAVEDAYGISSVSQTLLALSTEELTERMVELQSAQEQLIAIADMQTDRALQQSYIDRALSIEDEVAATQDLIDARDAGVLSTDAATESYDRLTAAVVGTFSATADLAEGLKDLEFAPTLETQLVILDKKLGRIAETWADVFETGTEFDVARLVEEVQEGLERIPQLINLGYTGEEIMGNLIAGLKAAGIEVSDAVFNILKEYVAAYLELNSPAQKGPLSTVHRYWEPMGDMLTQGLKRGMNRPGTATAGADVAGDMAGMVESGPHGGRHGRGGGGGLNIYGDIHITAPPGADGRMFAREFNEEMEEIYMGG